MFVITNEKKIFGASVLMHIKYIKELADRIESDLFIIPSSIHEVIAVPADYIDTETLTNMVNEVNMANVSPQEVLGNRVYSYSRREGLLSVV
jgi:hypothetical protein